MRNITENIRQAISDFKSIKAAIVKRGVEVPDGTPTSSYADMIKNLSPYPIYGVKGLYQSEPMLTRTDDAVGLDFVINSSSGSIDSDFNSVFPWSEAEIVEDEAGKFISMPEMYFRVGVDSENRLTDIAVSRYPSGDGDWYKVNPFMYGCYGGSISGDRIVSVSGVSRSSNLTEAEYRTLCRNNGESYHQLDLYHRTVMLFLWWIEFATKKSDDIMSGAVAEKGTRGGYSSCNTGGTDGITTPSGFELTRHQMRYHYIEDFIGNYYEFVDGVFSEKLKTPDYVTADPDFYSSDTIGKQPLSFNAPEYGCLAAFGWDRDKPFLCLPKVVVNNDNCDTYFCDRVVHNNAFATVLSAGSVSTTDYASRGLTWCNYTDKDYVNLTLGTRLLKNYE